MKNRWISTTFRETPPSVNQLPLNPRDPRYRRIRDKWTQDFCYAFNESGNKLPRNLQSVHAQAVLSFPQQRRRDSGNYKALIEKWLGDALQINHIADDTHDVYSFGNVQIVNGSPGLTLIIDYE